MSFCGKSKKPSRENTVRAELKPNQKMSGVEKCYGLSFSNNEVFIERNQKVEKASEEVRGLWVLNQLISNAETLGIIKLIIPAEEGGIEIPSIAPIDEYIAIFQKPRKAAIARLQDAIEFKEKYVCSLKAKMREMSVDSSNEKEVGNMAREQIFENEAKYAKAFCEWNAGNRALMADIELMDDWITADIKSGNQQYEADFDAIKNARIAIDKLKVWISKILKKREFSFIEEEININVCDSYKNYYLKDFYKNLVKRYRRDKKTFRVVADSRIFDDERKIIAVAERKECEEKDLIMMRSMGTENKVSNLKLVSESIPLSGCKKEEMKCRDQYQYLDIDIEGPYWAFESSGKDVADVKMLIIKQFLNEDKIEIVTKKYGRVDYKNDRKIDDEKDGRVDHKNDRKIDNEKDGRVDNIIDVKDDDEKDAKIHIES